MFFYLCKALFSGFLEFRGNFVDSRNNSKYRNVAPLKSSWNLPLFQTRPIFSRTCMLCCKLYSCFVIVQVKVTLALLHYKLELVKKPNGTKEFPARTCKDLLMCYPGLQSGELNKYGLLTKCEVKMAGYWPSSFFACLWTETESRSINTQKKNEANIKPS